MKYKADELEAAIERCMDYCVDHREPPVDFTLHKFTDISQDTMLRYLKWADEMEAGKTEVDPEVMKAAAAIKKWQEFKTIFWLKLGMNNEKLSAFAIFNLKQPCNGGYTDKPVGSVGNIEVSINVEGVGGERAFK